MSRQLFRAVYLREGKLKGMTFAARTPATAALFAYTVLEGYAKALCPSSYVLTVNHARPLRREPAAPQQGEQR